MSLASETLAPRDLTPDEVRAAYGELRRTLPAANAAADDWLSWFDRWNALKCRISGEGARRSFKEAQDTRDAAAEASLRHLREEVFPLCEEGDGELRARFLAAEARPELERRFGRQLFERLALEQGAFAPANIALTVKEGEVASQYSRLLGGAQVRVGDETLTMSRTVARLSDPVEARRRAAWDGLGDWLGSQRERIHTFYDELVNLRQQMAENLGEKTFVPVGYRRMGRSDYGPVEVASLREGIERHVVPVLAALRRAQARKLGVETVKPWDATYHPGLSLGPDVVPVGGQLAQAQALFGRLHPRLAGHFKHMVESGLIDLENRPGKRPGAFATSFDDEDLVAIFLNSTGNESDVTTLVHEMGHAFQGWESRWIAPLELRWPTMDACEIPSMGMEFLALREITAFFTEEQAKRYRKLKLINTLTRLPYMAMVDAFQHWVYEHPTHSHAEREATWAALWERFQPGVDYSGDTMHKQYRWMRQQHIFVSPFYYIDYAIAETCALQLWRLAETDREAAMAAYLELCRLGGTQSLLGLVEAAGLRSPFDPGVLAPLMEAVAEELEVQ